MKNSAANAIPPLPPVDSSQDLPARIARRAWELWLIERQPVDREAEIWMEAERQVLASDSRAKSKVAAGAFRSSRARSSHTAEAA